MPDLLPLSSLRPTARRTLYALRQAGEKGCTNGELLQPSVGEMPPEQVDSVLYKTGPRRANDRALGTEGVASMRRKRSVTPLHRATSLAALRDLGLGHVCPGPFGADAYERGKCWCGCGQTPRLAPKTAMKDGWIKGRPVPSIGDHRNRIPLCDRFKVDDDGCWIWLGAKIQGYPVMKDGGKNVKTFTWLWEQINGPMPPDTVPDHLCRVPACVNPLHVEPVTVAENTQRGDSAQLTWEAVREIRRLAGTVKQRDLAARFGVTQATVSRAVLRKSWANDPLDQVEPQLDLTDLAA